MGDGIISRSIGAIGKLKRVQSNRDGGANVALYKALKDLHDFRSLGSSQLEIPRVHTKQGESAFSYSSFKFQVLFVTYTGIQRLYNQQ